MTSLTHKEMTAHIRNRIKAAGIKARVRMSPSAAFGLRSIQIVTPSYGQKFTSEEAREIAFICDCNGMTGVRGDKIDVDLHRQLSGKDQFDFYMAAV